jgi:hypothetical protein
MASHLTVPIKTVGTDRWGQLNFFGETHLICGEWVKQKSDISFAGGHRVRLFSFKKNVHWKIPEGISLDVANVAPATAAPRRALR